MVDTRDIKEVRQGLSGLRESSLVMGRGIGEGQVSEKVRRGRPMKPMITI